MHSGRGLLRVRPGGSELGIRVEVTGRWEQLCLPTLGSVLPACNGGGGRLELCPLAETFAAMSLSSLHSRSPLCTVRLVEWLI